MNYELEGGTLDVTPKSSITYEDSDYVLPTPTREGYTFLGWTEEGETEPQLTKTVKRGNLKNRTFTAHWIKDEEAKDVEVEVVTPETGKRDWTYAEFMAILAGLIGLLTKFTRTREAEDDE